MPLRLFSRKNKSMVGVDIGTSRVKIVELTRRGDDVELTRAAIELAPPGAIRDGQIVAPDLVAEVIRQGLAEGRIKPGEVVAAIAGQGVVVRHVRFPRMPEEELREAIKWEGQQYIPIPIEEAVVDFDIIDGYSDAGEAEMEVMLVAAPRKLVNSHVDAIQLAGLTPIAIDVQPFTVLRALRYEPGGSAASDNGRSATAYIDIGAGTTDILIAQGERLRFTRIVPLGGNTFTNAIAEKLGISFEEAEKIKIEKGKICVDGYGEPCADEQEQKVSDAIAGVAADVATDIRRSLDYHDLQLEGRSQDAGVTGVVLTGGASVMEGLDSYLENELGLATVMGDPLQSIAVNTRLSNKEELSKLGPMLAVGIGLALREVVD